MDKEMEFQRIPIVCPKCKKCAFHWNGVTKIQISAHCSNCHTFLTFTPEKNEVKIEKFKPERTSSSGTRFY